MGSSRIFCNLNPNGKKLKRDSKVVLRQSILLTIFPPMNIHAKFIKVPKIYRIETSFINALNILQFTFKKKISNYFTSKKKELFMILKSLVRSCSCCEGNKCKIIECACPKLSFSNGRNGNK